MLIFVVKYNKVGQEEEKQTSVNGSTAVQ